MGYRSNVALGIAFVNRAAAREFVLKMQACQPEDMRQALSEYAVVCDSNAQEPVMFLAHFENVKWYPSYPDVIAHDGLRSLAEEAGATTRFVRVGEDIGDDIGIVRDEAHRGRHAQRGELAVKRANHSSNFPCSTKRRWRIAPRRHRLRSWW